MKKLLSLLLLSLVLVSCKKDDEDDITSIPHITFKSISPGTIKEYKDSVVIGIEYTDGDGDVGENGTGIENAFVIDSRNNLIYSFRIRQLAPDNANIIIRGNLSIVIPAVGLVNPSSSSESVAFQVYIKDRAGHRSNTEATSYVTVVP